MKTLYHITPRNNTVGILRGGLRPEMSRTRAYRVYAVEEHLIIWALAHVSDRHDTPVSALVVWKVEAGDHWKKWRGGIWYSEQTETATIHTTDPGAVLARAENL